jgi:RimJ/RimL family protein N-acetyltransferase
MFSLDSGGEWQPSMTEHVRFWLQELEEDEGLCVTLWLRNDKQSRVERETTASTMPSSRGTSSGSVTTTQDTRSPRGMVGLIGIRAGFIFYYLHPNYWGQGYCTEALNAHINAVFQRNPTLQEVNASVRTRNLASQRVLEKCGFSRSLDKKQADDGINAYLAGETERRRILSRQVEDELRLSILSLAHHMPQEQQQQTRTHDENPLIRYICMRLAESRV